MCSNIPDDDGGTAKVGDDLFDGHVGAKGQDDTVLIRFQESSRVFQGGDAE